MKLNEQSRKVLRVHVERVIYKPRKGSKGQYILLCEDENGQERKILGPYHEDPTGEDIVVYGYSEPDKRHGGEQFKAIFIEPARFVALERIKSYLASLGIPGIGEVIAGYIVDKFGVETFDKIIESPDLLHDVERIPKKSVNFLKENWHGLQTYRESILFLMDLGIPSRKIKDVHAILGCHAQLKIREDPYILCREVDRFGFSKADSIALKFGIEKESPVRKRALIENVLEQGIRNGGKCGCTKADIIDEGAKLLGLSKQNISDFVDSMIKLNQLRYEIVDGQDILYLPRIFDTEQRIAQMLHDMTGQAPNREHIDVDFEIDQYKQQENGLLLNAEQTEAVRMILNQRLSVMTGGPGVGKTTTLKTAVDILTDKGVNIELCAPTGMAAKRMEMAIGKKASTIHRLLGYSADGEFQHNGDNPIHADIIIVDEFSMIDVFLTSSLIEALGPETSLLIVGDVDQLPSIGPGRVLHDIISSNMVPVSRLTQIFRQGNKSLISEAASAINKGEMPPSPPEDASKEKLDFLFLKKNGAYKTVAQNVQDSIIELVCTRLYNHPLLDNYDPIRDVMVVAARKNGDAGANALNYKLRAQLNPLPPEGSNRRFDVEFDHNEGKSSFGIGDKVMNTSNKYDLGIMNGDIGYISGISEDKKELEVDFDCGVVSLSNSDTRDLQLAYAITVHKAQGSEAKVLLMPMVEDYGSLLQRDVVYTGLTRAKTLAMIVGSEKALARAVRTVDNEQRWSFTGEAMSRASPEVEETPDCDF